MNARERKMVAQALRQQQTIDENRRMAPIEADRERDLLASVYRELRERREAREREDNAS